MGYIPKKLFVTSIPSFGSLSGMPIIPKLPFKTEKEYDVIVIGGGTGGISCAVEASKLGLNTALFNYVDPSPAGSSWGLGGTCLNVGCIPKKLFHRAAYLGYMRKSSVEFGWSNF